MKKRFSVLTLVLVGFLMMATGVFAGEVFQRWVGEEHTQNTIANLEAIDTGITKLKTDLEKKEQDLLGKQAELDKANADLGNSITLEELKTLVSNTNGEPSLRKKYDKLKVVINKHLNAQDPNGGVRLNDHNDKVAEDKQLEQALKDVQDLETKSGEVLESLNPPVEP